VAASRSDKSPRETKHSRRRVRVKKFSRIFGGMGVVSGPAIAQTPAMENDRFDSPYLIFTADLAGRLAAPNLRIFDCTQRLVPDPALYVKAEPCQAEFDAAHIPGAGYLDLKGELSDPESRWRYKMPAAERVAAVFGRRGVGDGAQVVLYDQGGMMWATRIWWMLRSIGFDDAAVLDGGLPAWKADGRPLSTAPCAYAEASPPTVNERPGLLVGKDAVLAALDAPATSVVNALTAEQHAGGGITYGRPGRISGTVGVAARELTDPETGRLLPASQLKAKFADAGVDPSRSVLCYCGGGIAATLDAFVLTLMGAETVSVYDNSLQEWALDPTLPMETD